MTAPNQLFRIIALAVAVAFPVMESPARAAGPETPTATAEQLAEQAYQLHVSGKDSDAIATYLHAYELSRASALLFNIAMIYDRKLGERGLAEDYYRRYLSAPDAEPELVKKATERLTSLKKEDEAAAKRAAITVAPVPAAAPPPAVVKAPPPETPPPASSSGHAMRVSGAVVGVVGVAGVAASMVLGVLAKGKNDDANAVCNGAACSSQNGVSLANQAGTLATGATISFVAGLVLVGGGVTLFVLAPKDGPAPAAARITVSPRVGLSDVGLAVGGVF